MTQIDRDMQVGEALWALGVRDLTDVDAQMRALFEKAALYDEIAESVPMVHHLTFMEFVTEYQRRTELLQIYEKQYSNMVNLAMKFDRQLDGVRHWISKCRAWSSMEHGVDHMLDELEEEMK